MRPGSFPIRTRGHGLWDSGNAVPSKGPERACAEHDPGRRHPPLPRLRTVRRSRRSGVVAVARRPGAGARRQLRRDTRAGRGTRRAAVEPLTGDSGARCVGDDHGAALGLRSGQLRAAAPPRGARLPRSGSPGTHAGRGADLGTPGDPPPRVPGHRVRHPRAGRSRRHRRREGELGPGGVQFLRLRPGQQGRHLPHLLPRLRVPPEHRPALLLERHLRRREQGHRGCRMGRVQLDHPRRRRSVQLLEGELARGRGALEPASGQPLLRHRTGDDDRLQVALRHRRRRRRSQLPVRGQGDAGRGRRPPHPDGVPGLLLLQRPDARPAGGARRASARPRASRRTPPPPASPSAPRSTPGLRTSSGAASGWAWPSLRRWT